MASGTPDYYRTVRQTLGGAQSTSVAKVVTASVVTSLLTVTGKGIIYGGTIHVEEETTQKNSILRLIIDGTPLATSSFSSAKEEGRDGEIDMPFSIRIFDEVNFVFCMRIAKGFTFEESFEVDYFEKYAKTPTVNCRTIYALV